MTFAGRTGGCEDELVYRVVQVGRPAGGPAHRSARRQDRDGRAAVRGHRAFRPRQAAGAGAGSASGATEAAARFSSRTASQISSR